MSARNRTVLRVIAGGLLDDSSVPQPEPVSPGRERAALILCGIAYQCDPADFAGGRVPTHILKAWAPERAGMYRGESMQSAEREAAFEWLNLITEALGIEGRAA